MQKYEKLLLSELRIALYDNTEEFSLTHERLAKAVTLNENLLSLGYTLNAKDIILLAQSLSLDTFYHSLLFLMDEIPAKPMYPDFPTQVMEIDEATYRMHQLVHYFSTYGVESLFPVEVAKGWLPNVKESIKTREDDKLLEAKVLELIPQTNQYQTPFFRILSKRERMTIPEKEIISMACIHIPEHILKDTSIQFKENLLELSWVFFETMKKEQFIKAMSSICQHTGDVLRVISYVYKRNHYHFTKSNKKMFVRVLESFPISDFKVNIMISNKKREETLFALQALDYQEYSRSRKHNQAVKSLRQKELHSWYSKVHDLLSIKDENAVSFIGQHPGTLLRMVSWLVRLGYSSEKIQMELIQHVESLSMQTLVSILTHFGQEFEGEKEEEARDVYHICLAVFEAKATTLKTALTGRSVYLEMNNISLENSLIETNSKSQEGGYIRSGLALKIPDAVKRLRFFVYWNDKRRVDIDLHAFARNLEGEDIHIGWNSHYKKEGIVMSGDITHSNAAEYIDVDLENQSLDFVNASINIFSGYDNFKDIDECFVGMLAVNQLGEDVKLYNKKNCFFSHHLKGVGRAMNYGYIDVKRRILIFNGSQDEGTGKKKVSQFTLQTYLEALLTGQGCILVNNKEEAEVILTLEKAKEAKEVSLLDNNFFMEA